MDARLIIFRTTFRPHEFSSQLAQNSASPIGVLWNVAEIPTELHRNAPRERKVIQTAAPNIGFLLVRHGFFALFPRQPDFGEGKLEQNIISLLLFDFVAHLALSKSDHR